MMNSNFDNSQGKRNYRNNEYSNSNFKGRYSSKRESGGFRIRLSDNEMKSVKSIQDAFQLKSTVAVLGFAVRTLSELIKNEKLKEEITKLAINNKNSFQKEHNDENKAAKPDPKPNPFARPEKKQAAIDNANNANNANDANDLENLDEK